MEPLNRIVITGVPKSGKTTLAEQVSDLGYGNLPVSHSDDLIGHEWSEQSRIVADEWLNQPGGWVIEGVTAVRGLRKWMDANPDGKPCDVVYWSDTPKESQTEKQQAMGLGHSRIWDEVRGQLERRGVQIKQF